MSDPRAAHKRAHHAALLALRRAHPEEYERHYLAAGGRPEPVCGDCGRAFPRRMGMGAQRRRCPTCYAGAARAWCKARGFAVPARGRIPTVALTAWRAAHPDAPRLGLEDRIEEERVRREARADARRREAAVAPPVQRTCRKCGVTFTVPRLVGRKGRYPSYCPDHRPRPKRSAVPPADRWEVFQRPAVTRPPEKKLGAEHAVPRASR